MTADLDTLLTALYVELTDRIIPLRGPGRRGPGRPPDVTDAELACLAVAQALLRCDGLERHGGRIPAGLWTRIIQRLLALNACIWHNWLIGAPVKRSLITHDHI